MGIAGDGGGGLLLLLLLLFTSSAYTPGTSALALQLSSPAELRSL
jgi:hypothetical protein